MAEKSFIWDTGAGGDASPHSESDVADIFKAVVGGNGVLLGVLNGLAPSVNGSNVRMDTGWAIVKGHPYRNDSMITVAPTVPGVGDTGHRWVLRANDAAQTVRVLDLASADGTAAIPAAAADDVTICTFTITTGGVITLTDAREAAGGGNVDIQTFTASGTWAKPPKAKSKPATVFAIGWGGGGGGASGYGGAAGTNRAGGGGGGGGHKAERVFRATEVGDTETATVGAGGAAGAGGAGSTGPGAQGGIGGNTTFGSHMTAYGGGGGGSGQTLGPCGGGAGGGSSGAGGSAGTGGSGALAAHLYITTSGVQLLAATSEDGASGAPQNGHTTYLHSERGGAGGGSGHNASGVAAGNSAIFGGAGGGGAGGLDTSNNQSVGGAGGNNGTRVAGGGGTAGAVGGGAGGAGAAGTGVRGGQGGGGGGANSGGEGGTGGAGGARGGAGGGGGAGLTRGVGGAGGRGELIVITVT